MSEKSGSHKFSWGNPVIIKQSAPKHLHPGEFGSVCSVNQILSKEESERLHSKIGEWLYTVELGNGSDIQILEQYLGRNLAVAPGRTLSKYSHFLINGSVSKIETRIDFLEIQIKSLPISESVSDEIMLSEDGCLKGKIASAQIEKMLINHSDYSNRWEQKGNITACEVSDHTLKLLVNWERHGTTSIEIKSGQIWWYSDQ